MILWIVLQSIQNLLRIALSVDNSIMLWFLALNWRPPLATIVCFIQSVIKPKPTVNLMHVSPRFTTALRICMRFHRLGQWFDCVLCDRSNSSGFLVPHCITAAILNTFGSLHCHSKDGDAKRSRLLTVLSLYFDLWLCSVPFCYAKFYLTLRRHDESRTIDKYLPSSCDKDGSGRQWWKSAYQVLYCRFNHS